MHGRLEGVRDHPCSLWGCSEQPPVLTPPVGVGSGWLRALTPWYQLQGSCQYLQLHGVSRGGKTERKAARGHTLMSLCAAAFSSQLVSVHCYLQPSFENLCERVYRMSGISSYELSYRFFKPPVQFRIYYNL